MKNFVYFIFLFTSIFTMTAYSKDASDCPDIKELTSLLKSNPIRLAKVNIQNNDLFLFAISGYAVSTPGLDTEKCKIPTEYINLMPSLSDIRCEEHTNELMQSTRKFAKDYNSMIIRKLIEQKIATCK